MHELVSYEIEVYLHDPVADAEVAKHEYGVTLLPWEDLPQADAMGLAVVHDEFVNMDRQRLPIKVVQGGSFIDVKAKFDRSLPEADGLRVCRL